VRACSCSRLEFAGVSLASAPKRQQTLVVTADRPRASTETAMSVCTLHPLPYRPDPSAWFARIRQAPGAVLLDSGRPTAERGGDGRQGAGRLAIRQPGDGEAGRDWQQRLRLALRTVEPAEAPADSPLRLVGGLIGMFAYDFGRELEQLPHRSVDGCAL